jgi:hypothetical protein
MWLPEKKDIDSLISNNRFPFVMGKQFVACDRGTAF